jgi:hypothetical protein
MKTKILKNEDNRASIALLDGAGNPAHHLELVLHDSRKGKGPDGKPILFQYWAFDKGSESNNDLTDFQDWIGALGEAGALPCDADLWMRDAIGYRLNNGKFKTLQKVSKDGERLDTLSNDEKLANVVASLEGSAFKLRESGDSKAKLETKLAESEDKGKRMQEIFIQCRALETEAKTAKGEKLKTINADIAKLDKEFAALNA